MKNLLRNFEYGFTVFSLIIYLGGIVLLILSGGANEGDVSVNYNTALLQLIYLLIYFITICLLTLRWKKNLFVFTKNRFIWLLLIVASISVLWSFSPNDTRKDVFKLLCSNLFGVYFATRYTLKQQVKILGVTFGLAIILSFVFAIGLPKYGTMGGVHAGSWRGIFMHKNNLGVQMLLSFMVFLSLAMSAEKKAWLYWCGCALSLVLILMSDSTSSLINLILLISVFFILRSLWLPYQLMIPTIIGIATTSTSFYLWFKENEDVIFGFFGKDSNLSGRGDLWELVYDMIWRQPWFGYGYSGFWHGWRGESAYIWLGSSWTPTHPHSGFLELWLELGLLGLSIFWIGFAISSLRTILIVRLYRSEEFIFPAIMMVYLMLANLAETALLGSDNWILYVAFSSSTVIALHEHKNQKRIKISIKNTDFTYFRGDEKNGNNNAGS
ncbi:O-antigen ligase family protein [Nodularia harveyana UHCC-0300]|uniref:O-antigen ligase family protein n=1 Tax=Nodularia harveyana UHCC-0300 TaxID=2974287 RepID=A0ABU5U9Q4_9CYAN|nr:O-antigen ligase family protein [Nodularia harveyana]MEA5580247.1 O-antigen ligase family protein [Nodularia harveyana UHCC-0300]